MLNSGVLYLEKTAEKFPNKVAIIDDKRQVTFKFIYIRDEKSFRPRRR